MLLVLLACTGPIDVDGPDDSSPSTSDCRSGMTEADTTPVVVESLMLDGASWRPTVSLLCGSADGLSMRTELRVADLGKTASVAFSAPALGSYYLLDGTADVELGLDTVTWGQEDIVSGQGQLIALGDEVSGSLTATATSDDGSFQVDLTWRVPAS